MSDDDAVDPLDAILSASPCPAASSAHADPCAMRTTWAGIWGQQGRRRGSGGTVY